MKTFRSLVQAVMAALVLALALSTSFAQDAPPLAEDGQKTADVAPLQPARPIDSVMPEITGVWLMGDNGSFGRFIIRRTEEGSNTFEIKQFLPGGNKYGAWIVGARFQWIPGTRRFQGTSSNFGAIKGSVICTLSLDDQENTLEFAAKLDEDAQKSLEAIKPQLSKEDLGALSAMLSAKWTRNDRVEGIDLLLVETKDGLAGYSKSLGKWDKVVVGRPKNGYSRIDDSTVSGFYAFAIIDEWILGFSSKAGRWGKLKVPSEFIGKVWPQLGTNMLSVKIGSHIYALSPTTGEWTSLDPSDTSSINVVTPSEPGVASANTRRAEQSLQVSLSSPEAHRLTEQIRRLEQRAVDFAEQIRRLDNERQDGKNADTQAAAETREALKRTLAEAFDLKCQLEQARLRELRSRLSQLEQQIGRRQSQRTQIIDRRGRELVEGDETQWNSDRDVSTNTAVLSPVQSVSDSNVTTDRELGDADQPTGNAPRNEGTVNLGRRRRGANAEPPKKASSDETIDAVSQPRESIVDGRSAEPASGPSPRNIVISLELARVELESATAFYSRLNSLPEVVAKKAMAEAERQFKIAQRKYQLLLEELTAVIEDTQRRLAFAEKELEGAEEIYRHANADYGAGNGDFKTQKEAELRMEQAKLSVESLRALSNLYIRTRDQQPKKVSNLPPDGALLKPGTWNAGNDPSTKASDEFDQEPNKPVVWSILGMTLAPLPKSDHWKLGTQRYSGGMIVSDIVPDGPAALAGFQQGDILVGLEKWETQNHANVRWILDRIKSQLRTPEELATQVRFIVMRGKDERRGDITISWVANPKTATKR